MELKNNEKKVLFEIRNLKKYFPLKKKGMFNKTRNYVHANESISLDIREGETFGLVGESGCGKSTFGRTLLQIYNQTSGTSLYYGTSLLDFAPKYMGKYIDEIPKHFPEYEKASEEIVSLESELETVSDGEKKAELEDKLIGKRREVEDKYLNMIRIAGGLLVSSDLEEVKKVLKDYYLALKDRAKTILELKKIEEKKYARVKDDKLEDELLKDSKYTALKEELKKKDEAVLEKSKVVESLRDSLRQKEHFDVFENMKSEGIDLSKLTNSEMRELRKDLQIIFQDPYSSLDTRMTVGNIIGEGVLGHHIFSSRKEEGYNEYIQAIMNECGLAPYFIHRYPHQFSGGQRQRIGIARALALKPKFIVCDEAVSALDVSIQSQVINLLQDLKSEFNLTYLFITHDLSVVKYISDRIGVMYLGVMVELSTSDKIFENPIHPYTKALLEAIPRTDVPKGQTLQVIEGDIPSAVNPPKGCRFHTRCKYCMARCRQFEPEFKEVEDGHFVACFLTDATEEEVEQALIDNAKMSQAQKLEIEE